MKFKKMFNETKTNPKSNLKKRLITACILLPLVIFSILAFPPQWFAVAVIVVFLMSAWEWTRLAGFESTLGRLLGCIALPTVFLLILIVAKLLIEAPFSKYSLDTALALSLNTNKTVQYFFQILILGIWILNLCAVCAFPRGAKYYASRAMGIVIGALVLVPAFVALVALQSAHPGLTLYVLVLVWVADSGAYFAGKRFGRHKLAPKVSPGKTWEGVLGAVLGALLLAWGAFYYFNIHLSFVVWMLLNVATVLFSIVGDLFESLFKRMRNLKDSGNLLPGHGGLLDRIDSLTAALPIFAIGLMSLA